MGEEEENAKIRNRMRGKVASIGPTGFVFFYDHNDKYRSGQLRVNTEMSLEIEVYPLDLGDVDAAE